MTFKRIYKSEKQPPNKTPERDDPRYLEYYYAIPIDERKKPFIKHVRFRDNEQEKTTATGA